MLVYSDCAILSLVLLSEVTHSPHTTTLEKLHFLQAEGPARSGSSSGSLGLRRADGGLHTAPGWRQHESHAQSCRTRADKVVLRSRVAENNACMNF